MINNKIDNLFSDKDEVFFIADIGKNFIQTKEERLEEEYLENAKSLIKAAKEAGVDAVKFQTHCLEDEFLKVDVTSPHFVDSDRYSWIKRNEAATPFSFWQEIKKYADDLEIIFFSTPMSRGAAYRLEKIGVPLWKVGSADILDFATLDFMTATGKPIIISSGMSTLDEVDLAINFLKKRTAKIVLLHCVSKYPCPPEDLHLGTIKFFRERYNLPVGFSDHSIENHEPVLAAVKLGARIIEKHFTFRRDLWGADHKASLTPEEFKKMIDDVRSGKDVGLGNYGEANKILQDNEAVFRPFFRKSLMVGADIAAGTILTKEMIYAMRPQKYAGGLPSEEYEKVLNKRTKKDLKKYDPITWEVLE